MQSSDQSIAMHTSRYEIQILIQKKAEWETATLYMQLVVLSMVLARIH